MKSLEHYIALGAAMLFVALQHKEKPFLARVAIVGISGGFGYALSPELSQRLSWLGEVTAVALITAFIYIVLDVVGAFIADRQAIKEILVAKLGGRR